MISEPFNILVKNNLQLGLIISQSGAPPEIIFFN